VRRGRREAGGGELLLGVEQFVDCVGGVGQDGEGGVHTGGVVVGEVVGRDGRRGERVAPDGVVRVTWCSTMGSASGSSVVICRSVMA
jgi:hypothetical protein